MQIQLNGQSTTIPEPMCVSELVRTHYPDRPHVAVALNGSVVPRSQHDATKLRAGDTIEIVQAVGGG